jgi:hypothetical protein
MKQHNGRANWKMRITSCATVFCGLTMSSVLAMQPADQPAATEHHDLQSLPSAIRDALIDGEPEYALRALLEQGNASENDAQRSQARSIFRHAIATRLAERAEGAVVELIVHAPTWLGNDRMEAAVQLQSLWRNDLNPDRRSLTRRLNWIEQIQQAVRPSPFDPELPVTLTLLALDHVDHNQRPIDLLALLEIADRISPGNQVWAGYRPDDLYMLRAAEQMEREQKYLAAGEIYRRLIYTTQGDAEWFKRHYSNNQLNRVYALTGVAGADFAVQAAARVRQEYLEASELGRFRLLKENLRAIVAENRTSRRLPATVNGALQFDALPVGYLIENQLILQKGGQLTFGPGSVVRGGGRVLLEGGKITFEGTADEPVIVIGLVFESDDLQGGGIITGRNVQFRNCVFRRDAKPTLPGAMRWRVEYSLAYDCAFPFDPHVDVQFEQCKFDSSDMMFPTRPFQSLRPNDPEPEVALEPGKYAKIDGCIFIDCSVDDIVTTRSQNSRFIDCQLERWSGAAHRTEGDDGQGSNQRIVSNAFIPRGSIPAMLQRRLTYAPNQQPYLFASPSSMPDLRLGRVERWVD